MLIAHAVRRYGGVTEPFIEQRVHASGSNGLLWFETLAGSSSGKARRVSMPMIRAGSLGDRVFHRLPAIGPMLAGGYSVAELETRPSVIHAHYLTTGYLVGSRTRAPLVVSAYGFDVSVMPRRPSWRHAFRSLASRAAHVLVEGPHMREAVKALGFPHNRIAIVPISIEVEKIPYRRPVFASGPLRLISCGRFVEKKGHDSAIIAFAQLRPELAVGSTLQVIGDGAMRQDLQALAVSLGVGDGVQFKGTMERTDYLKLLSESDLLIAASRTARNGDSEGGAPTTILDAQASGVLVVGSDHADIPFLLDDGVTGFIAPAGTPIALTKSIGRALHAVDRWPDLADAARQQVQWRHSAASLARRLAEIYESVVR